MSVIFYDRLVVFKRLDKSLKSLVSSNDELQEIWHILEELTHHRIMGCVLDKLPHTHHKEFLEKFESSPHDEKLLEYLQEKIEDDMEEIIKKEAKLLAKEIVSELKHKKSNAK
ncbi:hypothetical protein ISR94_03330 [Candidatus Microgenomates bacterium]|nr:hypothetical protein [Candidatus Microgenomates bacterium]